LKGFEYTAKYNLGEEVPFVEYLDRTGKYPQKLISVQRRGELRAIYEQIYNHYANEMGIIAPFTRRAAETVRPEPAGRDVANTGFGTLFYSQPPASHTTMSVDRPAAPAGVVAESSKERVTLSWIEPIGANSYAVKRALSSGGPYSNIATGIASPTYTDTNVKTGTVYYYTVTGSNSEGESPNAFETSASTGLPSPWSSEDIGGIMIPGKSDFDDDAYTIEGAGADNSRPLVRASLPITQRRALPRCLQE
jgi:hypothetical protein